MVDKWRRQQANLLQRWLKWDKMLPKTSIPLPTTIILRQLQCRLGHALLPTWGSSSTCIQLFITTGCHHRSTLLLPSLQPNELILQSPFLPEEEVIIINNNNIINNNIILIMKGPRFKDGIENEMGKKSI